MHSGGKERQNSVVFFFVAQNHKFILYSFSVTGLLFGGASLRRRFGCILTWEKLVFFLIPLKKTKKSPSQAASVMSSTIAVSRPSEGWGSGSSGSSGTSTMVAALEYEGSRLRCPPGCPLVFLRQQTQCRQSCTLYLKSLLQGWQNW